MYTSLTFSNLLCACRPFNIKNFVHSFVEFRDNDSNERNVVFETDQITNNPFSMLGSNLQSHYGGLAKESWYKNSHTRGLPRHLIPEERLGQQEYNDDMIEIMG